jgi:hypothetical protein
MKKAKSTKAIDVTTMQPVKLKKEKSKAKPKPNFSTEKFVNVEDGKSFKKPVASLYIDVFQNNEDTCAVSIKESGSKNHIREAIVNTMLESDSYFELFMECAAIAMIDKAEKMAAKKSSKKKSAPKKSAKKSVKAVSKKPAKKK